MNVARDMEWPEAAAWKGGLWAAVCIKLLISPSSFSPKGQATVSSFRQAAIPISQSTKRKKVLHKEKFENMRFFTSGLLVLALCGFSTALNM